MPLYEFECDCGNLAEEFRPVARCTDPGPVCVVCGKTMRRRYAFTVHGDDNWCRNGTVYPGINGSRPLHDRAEFRREIKALGLEECHPREVVNAREFDWKRDMRKKLEAVTEKHAHA